MVKNNQNLNKNYNMINEYYDIAKKYFRGTISSEEEKRLSEWLKEAKNEHLFREWEDEWRTQAKTEASERTKAAWAKLQASGKLKVESQESRAESQEQKDKPLNDKSRKPQKAPKEMYAVQICASRTILEPNDSKLQGQKCDYLQVGEWYKYYTAADTDRKKVEAARKKLLKLFPDCWIITIKD